MELGQRLSMHEVNKELGYYYTIADIFTSRGLLKNALPDGTKMQLIDSFTLLKMPSEAKKLSDGSVLIIIQTVQIDTLSSPPYGLSLYNCTLEDSNFFGCCNDRKKVREDWQKMCDEAIQFFSALTEEVEVYKIKMQK